MQAALLPGPPGKLGALCWPWCPQAADSVRGSQCSRGAAPDPVRRRLQGFLRGRTYSAKLGPSETTGTVGRPESPVVRDPSLWGRLFLKYCEILFAYALIPVYYMLNIAFRFNIHAAPSGPGPGTRKSFMVTPGMFQRQF